MNVQVAMPIPGSPVYVKDVASVIDGVIEITSVSRYNGANGIGLLLKKQGDANAVDVSGLVREKLKTIEEQNKDSGLKFIIADDSTDNTTSVQRNNIVSQQVENFILQQAEVATLFSNIGGPSTGIGSLGVGSANKSEFTIQLKPETERDIKTEAFMKSLRNELETEYPGINFSMSVLGLLPKSAPIKITLSRGNLDLILKTSEDLRSVIVNIPGDDNVQLSLEEENPEYMVIPDKDKMQRLGLSTAYAGLNLRIAITGNDDATMTEKGTEYPVRIWLDVFNRENYEDVQHLSVVNPLNVPIEVTQFAEVMQDNSPSLLLDAMAGMPNVYNL